MNFFLESLICIIVGIYGNKLLAKNGISGKHITGLVLISTLVLFLTLPFMFEDLENAGEPSGFKDDDTGMELTKEEVWDGAQTVLRFPLAMMIAFFGSIGILIS